MSENEQNGRVAGQADTAATYLLAEARQHRSRLEALIMQFETAPHQIAALDGSQRQSRKMQDFPIQGVSRYIVPKSGFGASVTLAGGTNTALLPINEARLGLTITVSGTGAVTLYLGALGEIGARALPQIFLPPYIAAAGVGGSWNGIVGETLWCGNVCAVSTAGSSVSIAEI